MAIQKPKLSKPRSKRQRISESDLIHSGLRIGVWDIEATGLNAAFGHLLCVGVKTIGSKDSTIFRIDDFQGYTRARWDDRRLSYAAKKALEQYDVLVSYNGTRYDIPFFNTRLVENGFKPLSSDIKHADLLKTVRARMRLHSNRLDALTKFLGTSSSKTPLTPDVWRRAGAGDRASIDFVVDHNLHDLLTLEESFNKLVSLLDIRFGYVD